MAKKLERYTIEYYEEQIKQAETAIAVLRRSEVLPEDDLNIQAYKYYLQYHNVVTVANILSDAGFRYTNDGHNRKLNSNDISAIIQGVEIEDADMMNLARNIFASAKKAINKRFN